MTTIRAHHIAQINVGTMRAPLDSAGLAGFVALLQPLNALADAAPGFVWRLQADGADDATDLRPYDDPMVIVNMSVWTSLEALREYVYRTGPHLDTMRRRRDWFVAPERAHLALWWLAAGEIPTVAEGMARLERLRTHGPGPEAFTFRAAFPPPDRPRGDGAPAGLAVPRRPHG
jgi:hypothetical protein